MTRIEGERKQDSSVRLLIVEDDPSMARALVEVLEDDPKLGLVATHVAQLSDALDAIRTSDFDAVLVDLGLPDAQGMEAPRALLAADPDLPVIVLTGAEEEPLVELSADAGVQDFLSKTELAGPLLARTIRFAIARGKSLRETRSLALMDELTGLYNRRGFFTMAEREIRVAKRRQMPVVFFFIDVDGMKECNDQFGHAHGDELLKSMSRVLEHTFRESDVVARIGGDEFAVLSAAPADDALSPLARLEQNVERLNAALGPEKCPVRLSVGFSTAIPADGRDLDEMIVEADAMMYAKKRGKKVSREQREEAAAAIAESRVARREPRS